MSTVIAIFINRCLVAAIFRNRCLVVTIFRNRCSVSAPAHTVGYYSNLTNYCVYSKRAILNSENFMRQFKAD